MAKKTTTTKTAAKTNSKTAGKGVTANATKAAKTPVKATKNKAK